MALGGAALAAPALAQSFGNPDRPPQGAGNASPQSRSDPGPQTRWLAEQFPSFNSPPPTDVGEMPLFWSSFNTSPRRIQDGGWARQVTQAQFGISNQIAGVNMRLAAGGIRELHWHLAAEWAYMTYGSCRVTALDAQGRATVQDVGNAGDLWYFPAGMPHSLQGLGPDGCEFLIIFDDGNATEYNTLLLTRLDRAYAARGAGAELRRPGGGVLAHPDQRPVDLPGRAAGAAGGATRRRWPMRARRSTR